MKLQFKILIIVIPFVLLSLLSLGLWSFTEAKKTAYLSNYRYLRIVLESYMAESLHQNYQLLKEAKMDKVASYVKDYKQDAINKAERIAKVRGGHILILNYSGELIFCTQGFNSANLESSWNEISKKIVGEDSTEILEGYIDKKPYDDVYVAQYFKPWDWVVFYSIPNENISVLVNKIRRITLGITFVCALVGSLLIFLFSKKYLLQPIAKLKDAAQSIATHKNIGTISINSKDELGLLARSMEAMSKSIELYKTERKHGQKALLEKHEELQKSQVALKRHQDSLEQLVEERTFKLKESEERFRAIYEHAPVLIDAFDENGRCILWNNECRRTFGWTIEEINAHGDALSLFYPDPAVRNEVIRTVTTDPDAFFREWHPVTKDGKTLDTMWANFSLPDGLKFNLGYDITERKKLESRLQQSQKMESIGTLAGGIAHDFNNILYPIIGFSELLKEDLPPDSPEYESAQEIFNAGRRGGELVKQILAFSRQTEHKLSPVHFQKILTEVCKLIRSTVPSDIEIHQDIQKDCGLVMAEATQLHQIAMNLITNAYHAVEKASGKIAIQLKEIILDNDDLIDSPLQPGQYVMLSVSDNGVGIPKEIMNNIFEPYFTTKKKGKGTGLGLAVVYGILTEHKGDIKVYSEKGLGTTFNVYLPLMKKSDEVISTEKELTKLTGTERILLVDDEKSVVRLEKQMLERLGYNVSARSNSLEALETFNSNPDGYDLVISDMTMPNMTGDQLARKLMSIRPNIPIIICTGFSERLNKEQAESDKIKGFLMKPVVKSEMAQMVRKVLDETKISIK
jgi:PAS domain S-box-containing protein